MPLFMKGRTIVLSDAATIHVCFLLTNAELDFSITKACETSLLVLWIFSKTPAERICVMPWHVPLCSSSKSKNGHVVLWWEVLRHWLFHKMSDSDTIRRTYQLNDIFFNGLIAELKWTVAQIVSTSAVQLYHPFSQHSLSKSSWPLFSLYLLVVKRPACVS